MIIIMQDTGTVWTNKLEVVVHLDHMFPARACRIAICHLCMCGKVKICTLKKKCCFFFPVGLQAVGLQAVGLHLFFDKVPVHTNTQIYTLRTKLIYTH